MKATQIGSSFLSSTWCQQLKEIGCATVNLYRVPQPVSSPMCWAAVSVVSRYWNVFKAMGINDPRGKVSWQQKWEENNNKKKRGFTMERWARWAAWQAWNRATASSLLRRQLLLDLFQARALLEAAHAVDHAGWHVRPDTGLPAVGVDGKHMGSATKRADHNPAAVMAEGDILHLGNGGGKRERSHQRTHVQHRKWRTVF